MFGLHHPQTRASAEIAADALAVLGRSEEAAAMRARHGLADGGLIPHCHHDRA
jgi:hypothetical protein